MRLITTIYPTSDDYDSDDVRWLDENNEPHGFGYMSKKTRIIHIRYCPVCGNENYMSQSVCIKCGFTANQKGENANETND